MTRSEIRLVVVYAVGHGVMELVCFWQIAALVPARSAVPMALVYSAFAFVGPLVLSTTVPTFLGRHWPTSPGRLALVGALVVAAGSLVALPVASLVLLGSGSAAYHLAAGTATLRSEHHPAAAVGIFEGPGAVGRACGLVLGTGSLASVGQGWSWLLAGLAVLVGLATLRPGTLNPWTPEARPALHDGSHGWLGGALVILAVVSVLRAVAAHAGEPAWHDNGAVLLVGAAVCAGWCAGGVLGERVGLAKVTAAGFLVAGVGFVAFPPSSPLMLLVLCALALPMAPVLAVLGDRLRGSEPIAFGCAQLFQFSAVLLSVVTWNRPALAAALGLCALLAWVAFRPIGPTRKNLRPAVRTPDAHSV